MISVGFLLYLHPHKFIHFEFDAIHSSKIDLENGKFIVCKFL